jgi:fatty-acid desaturase
MRWWEFDSGWLLIRVLAFFRLLTINRVENGLRDQRSESVLAGTGVKA